MTGLAHPAAGEVVHVTTGELIPTEPARLAGYRADLNELRRRLFQAIKEVDALLLEEAERQGTKTLRYGNLEAVVTGGPELAWDIPILDELLAAGLPEARFAELVTIEQTYKVNAQVAKQLAAANQVYAEIIDRARSRLEKPYRVSIRR
jgi:hypothetical protein